MSGALIAIMMVGAFFILMFMKSKNNKK